MARKPWDSLSADYQKRLLHHGIGPKEHAEGADLSKARRHNEREIFRDWLADFTRLYGRDAEDVQEAIEEFGFARMYKGMRHQEKMQEAYHNGDTAKAHALWLARDTSLPEWMHFYHGYFS